VLSLLCLVAVTHATDHATDLCHYVDPETGHPKVYANGQLMPPEPFPKFGCYCQEGARVCENNAAFEEYQEGLATNAEEANKEAAEFMKFHEPEPNAADGNVKLPARPMGENKNEWRARGNVEEDGIEIQKTKKKDFSRDIEDAWSKKQKPDHVNIWEEPKKLPRIEGLVKP